MQARVISAVIAVLLLIVLYWTLGTTGIFAICALGVLACVREYSRVALHRFKPPIHIEIVFAALTFIIFIATVQTDFRWCVAALTIGSVSFLAMALMTINAVDDLAPTLQVQSLGLLGFLYCGIFPGMAVRLLNLEKGSVWLFGLMAVVFSGDTFAYLAGRMFGKRKLLESVSPKKTIEGSIGGLVGSGLAGAVLAIFFIPDRPALAVVFMALTTGAFAQVGDLFESLLKRVADVKDSGSMMPGHGGLLDRVDGLLFAAPIYYVLARFLVQ